jgi:hypothetical protein
MIRWDINPTKEDQMPIATDTIEAAEARIIEAIRAIDAAPHSIRIKQHGGPAWITRQDGSRAAIRLDIAAGKRTHDEGGMPLPPEARTEIDMIALQRALRDALPSAFPHSRVAVAVFW